ncbi:MAG: universal stress protein [Deltaproteobacteria bacterium]|nr:universal stress protein [Deltaproteobacteria bacterium]
MHKYKNALICLDNSRHSNWGVDIGVSLAEKFNTLLTGCHVYAAALHENRFKQMEFTLPPQYQKETELKRQRDNHNILIAKGLQIIAESYITVFEDRCKRADLGSSGKTMEGKNYLEIVKELQGNAPNNTYDLVILGALGLGATEKSQIGSVCERVARRARTDVLVVKEERLMDGKIVVAVDGSPDSFAGVRKAMALGKAFGAAVETVSAYDPHFHYSAFRNIAGILSEEAGRLFRFKEQETLHGEIIDSGLARIYQGHLDTANDIAKADGLVMETTLLVGKPYDQILRHVEKVRPSLLIMGRVGVHADETLDIGSNTENCLRQSGCNMLITRDIPASPEDTH